MRVDGLRTYRRDQEHIVMVRRRVKHEKNSQNRTRQGCKRAELGEDKCLGPAATLKVYGKVQKRFKAQVGWDSQDYPVPS